MNIEKMREEFEAWCDSVGINATSQSGVWAWNGWNASRESLVIELPKSWPEDRGYTAMDAEEVIAAIHAAGAKTK